MWLFVSLSAKHQSNQTLPQFKLKNIESYQISEKWPPNDKNSRKINLHSKFIFFLQYFCYKCQHQLRAKLPPPHLISKTQRGKDYKSPFFLPFYIFMCQDGSVGENVGSHPQQEENVGNYKDVVSGQNSPRQNSPKLQNIPRQNSPRQNSPTKADKIVPDKIVPNKIWKQL